METSYYSIEETLECSIVESPDNVIEKFLRKNLNFMISV